jgi:hypothetical protein
LSAFIGGSWEFTAEKKHKATKKRRTTKAQKHEGHKELIVLCALRVLCGLFFHHRVTEGFGFRLSFSWLPWLLGGSKFEFFVPLLLCSFAVHP